MVAALRRHWAEQAKEKLAAGELYEDDGLVFASHAGGFVEPSNLRRRALHRVLDRAGLPRTVTFHDLRHTCASLLFQRGVHPKLVQLLLGHASVAITLDTYSHMLPGMDGLAADALADALGGAPEGAAGEVRGERAKDAEIGSADTVGSSRRAVAAEETTDALTEALG